MLSFMRRRLSGMDVFYERNSSDPFMMLMFGCRAFIDLIDQKKEVIKIKMLAQICMQSTSKNHVELLFAEYMKTIDSSFEYVDDTIKEEDVKAAIKDHHRWKFTASKSKKTTY